MHHGTGMARIAFKRPHMGGVVIAPETRLAERRNGTYGKNRPRDLLKRHTERNLHAVGPARCESRKKCDGHRRQIRESVRMRLYAEGTQKP
jgi:hypothetical protein